MKRETIGGLGTLLGSLVAIILSAMVSPPSYGDDNAITVNASYEKKNVSFSISTSDDSPAIYGFIVTSFNHGHYSKIIKSPDGWSLGIIGRHSAMWTTKSHPIQPGSTEDNFVVEITRKGTYEIHWSVLDDNLQPVVWGTITITVTP